MSRRSPGACLSALWGHLRPPGKNAGLKQTSLDAARETKQTPRDATGESVPRLD